MTDLIDTLISARDPAGYPQRRFLDDLDIASLPIAERVDLDELRNLLLRANIDSRSIQIRTFEYDSKTFRPTVNIFSGHLSTPEAVMEHVVENMYADVFVGLTKGFAIWQPGNEDWYVLFAEAPDAKRVLNNLRPNANERFLEWAAEPFQSENSRSAALELFNRYNR